MSHFALSLWTILNDAGQWVALTCVSFYAARTARRLRRLERLMRTVITETDDPVSPVHPAFRNTSRAKGIGV